MEKLKYFLIVIITLFSTSCENNTADRQVIMMIIVLIMFILFCVLELYTLKNKE